MVFFSSLAVGTETTEVSFNLTLLNENYQQELDNMTSIIAVTMKEDIINTVSSFLLICVQTNKFCFTKSLLFLKVMQGLLFYFSVAKRSGRI